MPVVANAYARDAYEAWAALDAYVARLRGPALWECPDCGFTMDAVHEDDVPGGGYTCPACETIRLTAEVARLRAETTTRLQNEPDLAPDLAGHWLYRMECDEITHGDTAYCSCGWGTPKMKSIGDAAAAWWLHALGEVDRVMGKHRAALAKAREG